MAVLIPPRFGLEVLPDRARVTLRVSGELDIATAPKLQSAVDELWQSGWCDVAIDFGDVEFVDSTGLATLLSLCRAAQTDGRRLAITGSCASLDRLVTISKLEHALARG